MPKAPNMYQCSNYSECGGYMTHKERHKMRVIVTSPDGSKVQYDEDLCPSCKAKQVAGKDLKQLKSSSAQDGGGEQEPTPAAVSAGERQTAKSNGVSARRSRPAKDGDSTPSRRSRSTTSSAH